MAVPVQLRILALTATPGCKFLGILCSFQSLTLERYSVLIVSFNIQQSNRQSRLSLTICMSPDLNIAAKLTVMLSHMFTTGR